MKSTESLMDEGKTRWNKIKTEMDEFSVQFALGKNEAKDTFDREWDKFSGFMNDQAHRLRRQSYWTGRVLKELGDRTTVLKSTLKEAVPEKENLFNDWRESILRVVYELEFMIDELYPVMEPAEKELLSTFRIKMEVYRTRLIMTGLNEINALDAQATHLIAKADEVLLWRNQDTEKASEKIQQFGKEISTSFDHMKKAFSGLFN